MRIETRRMFSYEPMNMPKFAASEAFELSVHETPAS